MDPLTMFTIASVAASAGGTVWNYFAGQDAIAGQRKRLATQKTKLDERFSTANKTLEASYAQAQQDVVKATGNTAASLAQNGIGGPMADHVTSQVMADSTTKLDQNLVEQKTSLDLQYQDSLDALDTGASDLTNQKNQFDTDFLMGLLGVGLTGAAQVLSLQKPQQPGSPAFFTSKRGRSSFVAPNMAQ